MLCDRWTLDSVRRFRPREPYRQSWLRLWAKSHDERDLDRPERNNAVGSENRAGDIRVEYYKSTINVLIRYEKEGKNCLPAQLYQIRFRWTRRRLVSARTEVKQTRRKREKRKRTRGTRVTRFAERVAVRRGGILYESQDSKWGFTGGRSGAGKTLFQIRHLRADFRILSTYSADRTKEKTPPPRRTRGISGWKLVGGLPWKKIAQREIERQS